MCTTHAWGRRDSRAGPRTKVSAFGPWAGPGGAPPSVRPAQRACSGGSPGPSTAAARGGPPPRSAGASRPAEWARGTQTAGGTAGRLWTAGWLRHSAFCGALPCEAARRLCMGVRPLPLQTAPTRSSMPPMERSVSRSAVATASSPLLLSSSAPQAVPSAGGRAGGRAGGGWDQPDIGSRPAGWQAERSFASRRAGRTWHAALQHARPIPSPCSCTSTKGHAPWLLRMGPSCAPAGARAHSTYGYPLRCGQGARAEGAGSAGWEARRRRVPQACLLRAGRQAPRRWRTTGRPTAAGSGSGSGSRPQRAAAPGSPHPARRTRQPAGTHRDVREGRGALAGAVDEGAGVHPGAQLQVLLLRAGWGGEDENTVSQAQHGVMHACSRCSAPGIAPACGVGGRR